MSRRPDFLYIGAAKAGSSWLFEVLREHPKVFIPDAKDIQFFDAFYSRGTGWYCRFFERAEREKVAGEIGDAYFLHPESASRIYALMPTVKLLVCLRDPVERTLSRYVYSRSTELGPNFSMEEFCLRTDILRESSYAQLLRPFYQLFPRDNILILFFDDMKSDPITFIQRVYEFIGVDREFVPPSLNRKVLESREARNEFLAHTLFRGAKVLRSFRMENFVGRVKRNRTFNTFFYKPLERKPEMPGLLRTRLYDYFSEGYLELSALVGRDVPDSWYNYNH